MPKVIPQLLIPPARYPQYRGTLHIETHRTALVSNHPFPLGAFTSETGRWTLDLRLLGHVRSRDSREKSREVCKELERHSSYLYFRKVEG